MDGRVWAATATHSGTRVRYHPSGTFQTGGGHTVEPDQEPTPDRTAVIAAKGLTEHGEAGALLDDVTFDVRRADIYCLAASPPTVEAAVALAAGLRSPAGGQFTIAGHDVVASQRLARRHATIVTRRCGFFAPCSVRRNAQFFVTSFDGRAAPDADVDNALRRVGVPERAFGQSVASAPSGVAMRLWLAIALLRKTPATILDEPTDGLDARSVGELREAIAELRSAGQAILVVTSDVAFAAEVGDRIGVVRHGQKVDEKTRHELTGDGLTQFFLEHVGRLPARSRRDWPRL